MNDLPLVRMAADLFPSRERWVLAGVFGVTLVAALFETLGVASVLPFMALVVDPASIERFPMLSRFTGALGAASAQQAVLVVGVLTIGAVALGNAAGIANVLVQQRFGARTSTRFAADLFAGYMRQPYAFHVSRDAPSLIKIVVNDAMMVTVGVVSPLLVGVSRGLVVVAILVLLFIHDPVVALSLTAVLTFAYAGIFRLVRNRQHFLGLDYNQKNLERQRISQEALGGIKELQVLGRSQYALEQFHRVSHSAAAARALNGTIVQLPRYVLETVGFGGILLVSLILVAGENRASTAIIPMLALYAFAGYRLLPALQQVYASAAEIRFYLPALRELHRDFILTRDDALPRADEVSAPSKDVHFARAIRLENVSFTYAAGKPPALRDVDLTIRPGESIGLVGRTGAGKTTLADLILGLYEPSAGTITVDGVRLARDTIAAWRRHVGYVPQHVFLANASLASNIAFGLPPEAIDMEAVQRAARMAHADEFIRELPLGYETVVGERGVKLSGGQRQRIGIARALYGEPEVLVFDEATSALDGLTEDAVMQAIRSLAGQRTVILIAHRLRTVEACDRIVVMGAGRIAAVGAYHELLETCTEFRSMVGRTDGVRVAGAS